MRMVNKYKAQYLTLNTLCYTYTKYFATYVKLQHTMLYYLYPYVNYTPYIPYVAYVAYGTYYYAYVCVTYTM